MPPIQMSINTLPGTKSIHGTDPQFLIEKIVRERIYESLYWKQECYDLTTESLVEKAVRLSHIGSTFGGNQKPTPFLCLLLKLLQLQPDFEIVYALIKDPTFKYLRILASFYLRLVGRPRDIYENLEPLYSDYRKIRVKAPSSDYYLLCIDQVIETLLNEDGIFSIHLPRIPKRRDVEAKDGLAPRTSCLADQLTS